MVRVGLNGARAVLLGGPAALAFFTGGYFNEARAWAGLGAWLLVLAAIALQRRALPRAGGAWVALGGLAALAAWTLASIGWAPIAGSAYHASQVVILYVGVLLAATLLLRERRCQRAVEPALAAGTLIVVGYGISERLLPGLLHFSRSITAEGRLEQPLTYWNAMGELAALGFVLCARIAGDTSRALRVRVAAAAAAAPLGMGLYLSVSRGALFACAAGVVALLVLAPRRAQLEALIVSIVAGGLASAAAAPFGGVTRLLGALSTRERQGAITLALLVVIMVAAAAALSIVSRRADDAALRLPRRAGWLAVGLVCAGLGGAIAIGAKEGSGVALSPGASRYTSVQSNRYAYWDVALRAFSAEPIRGVGAGGWSVWWLRYRTITEGAEDAHSLPLQTLAELGLVGFAFLLVFVGGVAAAAAQGARAGPALAAGPIAALVVYLVHAPLDWDWQMPAVTLVAMVLAGMLLALAGARGPSEAAGAAEAPRTAQPSAPLGIT
jgi:hypothetical protein